MAGFSAQGLTRLKSRVSRAAFLCGGSGEESASRLIQVVGSIQFLAVIGLKNFISSLWSEATLISEKLPVVPCHLGFSNTATCFPQASKGEVEQLQQNDHYGVCRTIMFNIY